MTTLYAWAIPAFYSEAPVDHTWVSDYDNRVDAYATIGAVVAAGANYWFCWGSFHQWGSSAHHPGGSLGIAAGDLAQASCLCTPNVASNTNPLACGTIYTYGVDGVCHQLANQVLWATASPGVAPLTVAKARGYFVSTFIYGTYGIQHAAWAARKTQCMAPGGPRAVPNVTDDVSDDEFTAHARAALASVNAGHKLEQLIVLRQQVHTDQLAKRTTFVQASAEELNARNNAYLQSAKALLTPAEFEAVFGFTPEQTIALVDPTMKGGPKRT